MDRKLEERLQDYLDGRMPADERARFEDQLERDPDLAALVRADTEAGTALREGDEQLSPGFYTRARAHFKASARPAGRRRFRLLSWETAGLSAAVLLAGALFVPMMFRDGQREQAFTAPPERALEALAEDEALVADDETIVEKQAIAEDAEDAGEGATLDALGYTAGGDDKDEAPKKLASEPQRKREKGPALDEAPAPSDAPARGDVATPEPVPEERAEAQYAPAPPAAPAQAPRQRSQKAAPMAVEQEADAGESYRDARDAAQEVAGEDRRGAMGFAGSLELHLVRGVPLPEGLVDPGELRRVENEESWARMLAKAGAGRAALGVYDPRRRLVLIGSLAAPFDCLRITVRQAGANYVITLSPPSDASSVATHGCGVPLPRDGRGVIVEPFPPVE
jgi:hypothetical protein